MPPVLPELPGRRLDRAVSLAVLLAACVLAAHLYAGFWPHAREVWWWPEHDRHTHYLNGLNLAMDVRTFDLSRLRHDLDGLRVWGPLHSFLVGAVELVAGPNYRLAVLPSLAGWVLTVWLGFLLARRMLHAHGNAAGLAAAALLAAVPAHRAFATDVMLESSGAALSLLALYFYVVAVQDGSPGAGVPLALSLLALFFHKYNYWLLVVLGLVAAEFLRQPRAWLAVARIDRLRVFLRSEARQPLSWIALLLFLAACFVWKDGGVTLPFGNRSLPVHEPHTLFTVAFWALALRLGLWWRAGGRALAATLDPRLRPVLVWHGFAMTLWFAVPKRLGYFLWYLSPANTTPEFDSTTPLDGVMFYLRALAEDYCASPWEVYALLAGVALAALLARGLRPGSAAVLMFFVVAALLTARHPMTKHRFAHTWVAAGWVLAAVGLFAALRRCPALVGGLVCLGIAALHLPGYVSPGHAHEAGRKPELACPLAMTDVYLPHVTEARHTTIFSNVPARFLFGWTFLEAHRHTRFATEVRQFKEKLERDPAALAAWLERTPSDALVLIESRPGSPFAVFSPETADLTTLAAVLERQQAFSRERRWELPEGVTISLWRKGPARPRLVSN
jgi:hypothetical protein